METKILKSHKAHYLTIEINFDDEHISQRTALLEAKEIIENYLYNERMV